MIFLELGLWKLCLFKFLILLIELGSINSSSLLVVNKFEFFFVIIIYLIVCIVINGEKDCDK